ncbi:hypothetical protein Bhyg_14374, partial [Pseudolycoriella hygida]
MLRTSIQCNHNVDIDYPKVILVLGIYGATRADELTKLRLRDTYKIQSKTNVGSFRSLKIKLLHHPNAIASSSTIASTNMSSLGSSTAIAPTMSSTSTNETGQFSDHSQIIGNDKMEVPVTTSSTEEVEIRS